MSDARMRQPVYAPVDFLIITALPEEREALLGLLANVTKIQFNRLYHDLNCLGHKTRFLGILPVFLGSKRHFCADSLPLVEKNVAQN
jgi:hypothetical protein